MKIKNQLILTEKQKLNDNYKLQICYIEDLRNWIYYIFKNDELIKSQAIIEDKKPQDFELLKEDALKNIGIILSIEYGFKELNIEINTKDIVNTFATCNNDLLDMINLDDDGKPYKINQLLLINKNTEFYKNEILPLVNKIKRVNIDKSYTEIEKEIIKKLNKHKKPSDKLLADFITLNNDFYINYSTQKKYIKTDTGFEEITSQNIAEYFNNKFGANKISLKSCENTIDYITNPIKKDYNLIIFKNGTLNTDTNEFKENEYKNDVLPKIKTDLNYYPNAEKKFKDTDLYHEIKEILYCPNWKWNETLYYKMVGASLMATNEKEKLITIIGAPNSRKTTLLTILKKIFNYSEIKLQTIAKNERFQLIDCIDKDINIDDDIQGFMIEEIGTLNTMVSGAGIWVELKGKNQGVNLTAETTPILWNVGNKLPTVKGDGFERRIVVIKADNALRSHQVDETYKKNILDGKRDDEISLLISYSYQLYFKNRKLPVVDEKIQDIFMDEWKWKSYPAKKAAEIIFMDSSQIIEKLEAHENVDINSIKENRWNITYNMFIDKDDKAKIVNTYVTVNEANKLIKKFFKEAFKMGLIVKEQSKPNIRTFKSAMESAGYNQISKNITGDDSSRSSEKVYDDCIVNPNWLDDLKKIS